MTADAGVDARAGTGPPPAASGPAVAVVGAGVTGLALTHHLREHGVDVSTFEARETAGGVVRSRELDGRVAELGPQRLRLSPPVEAFVAAAGLDSAVRTADEDRLWVHHDGALHRAPLSLRAALGTSLLPWRSKVRVLAEPLAAPPHPGESVDAALARNVGRTATDRLFAPLYAGLYGSDPAEMPARYSLCPALETHGVGRSLLWRALRSRLRGRTPPPVATVEGGLGRLTGAVADQYEDRVHLGEPVLDLSRADGAWAVETADRTVLADRVVTTTPAAVTADLLAGVDPGTAEALDALRYNAVTHVYLDVAPDDCPPGLGYVAARDSALWSHGATFGPGLFGADRAVTVSVDGDPPTPDRRVAARARREFETVTGAEATVLGVHRWSRGIPALDRSFDARERVDPPAGLFVAGNFTGRPGVVGRLRQGRRLAATLAGD
jgi:oxygen-dependent protoporphyrinogen oxidase